MVNCWDREKDPDKTSKPKEYVRYTEKEDALNENYDKKWPAILWTFIEQKDVRYHEIASRIYLLCGKGKLTYGTHTLHELFHWCKSLGDFKNEN